MSLGARTKSSGPPATGSADGVEVAGRGNQAGLLLARLSLLPALLAAGWLVVGLPMLMAGVFSPVAMVIVGVPVMMALGYAGWRGLAGWPGQRLAGALAVGSAPWWSVAAVIAVAVAFGADQVIFHSQFVIVTRDPASYVQFGAWIAGHGSLPIPQDSAAFGLSHDVTFQSAAFYQVGGSVVPQFMAGLPMVLAAGFWIGGVNAAVLAAPVLGACAILTFGGLVARLVAPRWAPLAALALAVTLPMQFTSRSTYSEPLAAVLFLGGLCLVVDCLAAKGAAARVLAGLGGLALGLTFLVRLDGASDILPVIPYCGLLVVTRRPLAWPMIAGFALGAVCGVVDGVWLSWPYLQANMTSVQPLAEIAIVVVVLTIAVTLLVLHGRRPYRPPAWAGYAAAAVPVLVMIGFTIRPYLQVVRARSLASFQSAIAAYQLAENQPIDPSRQYYEISLRWVFWYVGIPAVVLATLAAAILARRCIRGTTPSWTLPLLIFGWAILSTLYRPAITPDQPWASRRLVPAVLPGFLLLAVWAVRWITDWLRARGTGVAIRGVVIGCCAVALLVPATITTFGLKLHDYRRAGITLTATGLGLKTTYAGEISAVQGMCRALPRKASVVFVNAGESKGGNELAEVIRGMCDEPAAIANDATTARVAALLHGIRQAGRVPVLLAGYGRALMPYGGVPRRIMALHTTIDSESLTVPPTETTPFNLAVWMTEPPT
jgi:hypothetical protein